MVGRKIKLDACKVCGMHKSRCICNIDGLNEKVKIERTKSKPKKRVRKEKMPARIKKGH